jgi:hypothetical protein
MTPSSRTIELTRILWLLAPADATAMMNGRKPNQDEMRKVELAERAGRQVDAIALIDLAAVCDPHDQIEDLSVNH